MCRDGGLCFALSGLHGRRAVVCFIVLSQKRVGILNINLAVHPAPRGIALSMEVDEVVELLLKGRSARELHQRVMVLRLFPLLRGKTIVLVLRVFAVR